MRTFRAVVLVMLIGCGSSSDAPVPAPAPTPAPRPTPQPALACDLLINTAAQRIAAESKRLALPTTVDRTATVMIASCEAEAWPAPVLACIAAARLDADLDACTEDLTYRQHKRLHDKIAAVTPPPPRPPVVVARPLPQVDPLPSATTKLDCSRSILSPRDRACIKQFCDANQTDVRCMID